VARLAPSLDSTLCRPGTARVIRDGDVVCRLTGVTATAGALHVLEVEPVEAGALG
jgi:hypothetical protein